MPFKLRFMGGGVRQDASENVSLKSVWHFRFFMRDKKFPNMYWLANKLILIRVNEREL